MGSKARDLSAVLGDSFDLVIWPSFRLEISLGNVRHGSTNEFDVGVERDLLGFIADTTGIASTTGG